MAVAVKTSDKGTPTAPASVQVLSLVGLALLLAGLALVFWVVPTYLPKALKDLVGPSVLGPNVQMAIVVAAMLLSLVVVGFVGRSVLGTRVVGVRAGVFFALCWILGILLVGAWFGGVMEWLTFDKGWFGSYGRWVGIVASAVFAGFLVLLFLRWFFAAGTAKWLQEFEEGGWFSWTSYKPQQGVRVRRGTIIGLLILFGAGVYALIAHNTLNKYDTWSVGIPFTGTLRLGWDYKRDSSGNPIKGPDGQPQRLRMADTSIGDAGVPFHGTPPAEAGLLQNRLGWDGESDIRVDRWVLRDEINSNLNPKDFVHLDLVGADQQLAEFGIKSGVMPRDKFEEGKKEFEKNLGIPPRIEESQIRDPIPAGNPSGRKDPERLYAGGSLEYTPIPLLPAVKYTVPLLLLVGSLWFAWRLVNYPPFGDFLIATEAELNKVSWTTRKRLFQDTIVVLVTVLLMAGFLLIVDLTCKMVLGSPLIYVIQVDRDAAAANKNAGPKPW